MNSCRKSGITYRRNFCRNPEKKSSERNRGGTLLQISPKIPRDIPEKPLEAILEAEETPANLGRKFCRDIAGRTDPIKWR